MKILSMIFSMLLLQSAWAQNLNFVFYYPPGGSVDLHSRGLISALENQGATVNRTYVKSCPEALSYVEKTTNSILVTLSADLRYDASARCPSINNLPNMKLYSGLADAAIVYCTSPKRRDLTLEKIAASKDQLLVAVPTVDVNWITFEFFAQNQKTVTNLKMVPYKGGGDLKVAVLAGNVDLFYLANVSDLLPQGAKCLAASTRKNAYGLPFLGDLTTIQEFPEISQSSTLWYANHLDLKIDDQLRTAMDSPIFRAHLANNFLVHRGLASGISPKSTLQSLIQLDTVLRRPQ